MKKYEMDKLGSSSWHIPKAWARSCCFLDPCLCLPPELRHEENPVWSSWKQEVPWKVSFSCAPRFALCSSIWHDFLGPGHFIHVPLKKRVHFCLNNSLDIPLGNWIYWRDTEEFLSFGVRSKSFALNKRIYSGWFAPRRRWRCQTLWCLMCLGETCFNRMLSFSFQIDSCEINYKPPPIVDWSPIDFMRCLDVAWMATHYQHIIHIWCVLTAKLIREACKSDSSGTI